MTSVRLFPLLYIAALGVAVPVAHAQDPADQAPPAHIAVVDGAVSLDRDDQTQPADLNMPLVPGDRLRTDQGRVELLFPDGSALDVDESSSVELQGPALLRVIRGRVLLTVAGAADPSTSLRFQIDTPIASASTDGPGEYRVAVLSRPSGIQTELAVLRGNAALTSEAGSTPLRAGERSVAWANEAPLPPQPFNSARFDAFDEWAAARRDSRLGSAASAQYLPPDLRMYSGTFDRYGGWQYVAPYGYVWYPNVAATWQPYYYGYWETLPHYGWTWIGVDTWGWPTHHYGRWGYARSRWFWIPGHRWGPAWVSWGAAPGYVTWCPLGFDGRPVFSLSVSLDTRRHGGWIVLPRSHFGERRGFVSTYAVSSRTLPPHTPWVTQAAPPVPAPRAIPRRIVGNTPGGEPYAARGYAVPRRTPGAIQAPADDLRFSRQPGRARSVVPSPGTTNQQPGLATPRARVRDPRAVQIPYAAQGASPSVTPFNRAEPDGFKRPLAPRSGPQAVPRVPRGRMTAPPQPDLPTVVLPGYTPRAQYRSPYRSPQSAAPGSAPTIVPRSSPPAPSLPSVGIMTSPGFAAPRYAPRSTMPGGAAVPAPRGSVTTPGGAPRGSVTTPSVVPQRPSTRSYAVPRSERAAPPPPRASSGGAAQSGGSSGNGARDGGSAPRQHAPSSRRPR